MSSSLAIRFPRAFSHPDSRLLAWFPQGVLDDDAADQVVDFLEEEESITGPGFHRFTDMTGFTRVQIALDHVVRLARRRRAYAGPPVKSAFYAVRLISLSIARMYDELLEGSSIQVCIFRDRAAAADWLGVPADLLNPPK